MRSPLSRAPDDSDSVLSTPPHSPGHEEERLSEGPLASPPPPIPDTAIQTPPDSPGGDVGTGMQPEEGEEQEEGASAHEEEAVTRQEEGGTLPDVQPAEGDAQPQQERNVSPVSVLEDWEDIPYQLRVNVTHRAAPPAPKQPTQRASRKRRKTKPRKQAQPSSKEELDSAADKYESDSETVRTIEEEIRDAESAGAPEGLSSQQFHKWKCRQVEKRKLDKDKGEKRGQKIAEEIAVYQSTHHLILPAASNSQTRQGNHVDFLRT